MRLREIAELLDAEVLGGHLQLELEISQALGSDIMSQVLSTPCGDSAVLLTGLTNLQVVRTAEMVDVKAVIFVKGRCPRAEALRLAGELNMPVLLTHHNLAETCELLTQSGLQAEEAQPLAETPLLELSFPVTGNDFVQAGDASSKIKRALQQIGMDPGVTRRVAIIAYEAEMNIVIHAQQGELSLTIWPKLVQVVASDVGPGISDVELAMQVGYSTAPASVRQMGFGAGMGLPNIKRCSDEMQVETEVDVGTRIVARINL